MSIIHIYSNKIFIFRSIHTHPATTINPVTKLWIQNRFLNSKTLQTITHFPNTNLLNHSSFFFFISSSSHLFINNNAIPNPILFTFFKNYNLGTESNHFHCIPSISGLCLLPHQTPSYSHCSSCTVRTGHHRNCHSETHSAPTQPIKPINLKPNQAKSSPTQPETHRWFDWCGLMIGEAFVWWFDDQRSAWFDDLSAAVVWWSMAIEEWFDEMKKERVRWEWPKPRDKERRKENRL